MASSSGRRSGSSGRSTPRKRVVIGAQETVRVRYEKDIPQVEAERKGKSKRKAAIGGAGSRTRKQPAKPGQRISAAKRQEREQRQRRTRLKRGALYVLAALAVAAVIVGLVALTRAPVFAVDAVVVEGAAHLSDEQVIKRARVPMGASLVTLPTSAIARRLQKDPWIESATVDKDFPSTIAVTVVERTPIAIVDAGGTDLWVIAADGTWLGERSAEETGLVVIRDLSEVQPQPGRRAASKELRNALRVVAGLSPELSRRVIALSAPTVDKTVLMTDDDVEIFVGEAVDMAAKDRIAREILAREKENVVYINVRVIDRPTWRGLEDSNQ